MEKSNGSENRMKKFTIIYGIAIGLGFTLFILYTIHFFLSILQKYLYYIVIIDSLVLLLFLLAFAYMMGHNAGIKDFGKEVSWYYERGVEVGLKGIREAKK